jgi:hypothetical protein
MMNWLNLENTRSLMDYRNGSLSYQITKFLKEIKNNTVFQNSLHLLISMLYVYQLDAVDWTAIFEIR